MRPPRSTRTYTLFPYTSLCRSVLSISCTTRAPRPSEENHKHYRFISHEQFNSLREQNALLEWAEVHGNYYGTPRDRIDEALQQGKDVLLEIDWQGARQVREHYTQAIGIFILPPSIEALETRLTRSEEHTSELKSLMRISYAVF